MKKCLVVLSGGQDSTTCLFWAKKTFEEVHAITFDYNQRHARELDAARTVAELAGVASHTVVTLGPVLKGRSPLVNSNEQLETYQNYEQMDKIIGDRVELTFVPMRNALFLTLAANHAICNDIYDIVTGVCQADNANYPDCRLNFIHAQQFMTRLALGLDKEGMFADFRIHTPLMNLSKADSIMMTQELPGAYEALAYTHTAYDGQYPPVGHDHATTLRAHGFKESGYPDPLVVRAWNEGLMELPDTPNYKDMDLIHSLLAVLASKRIPDFPRFDCGVE